MPKNFDLIIIGGGISGLYTALNYISKNKNTKSVLILEKNNKLGGRILTIKDKKSNYEAGAARINHSHKNIMNLIKKYKLNLIKIPNHNEIVSIPHNKYDKYNLKFTNTYEFVRDILNKSKVNHDFRSVPNKYTLLE